MNKETASQDKTPKNMLLTIKQIQARFGYLPPEHLAELAHSFNMPVNDIYGVASFYSFLSTQPQGRNVIRICRSIPCFFKDAQIIIDTIKKEIGISPGKTTPDGRFSFELVNCIGLCDHAPAMLINSDPHIDLTPDKISRILQNYK